MKKLMEKLLSWTMLYLIFVIVIYFTSSFFRTSENDEDDIIVGRSIYDFIKVEPVKSTIKNTNGKILLIFFFTTSCPSCYEDVGYWHKLANEYKDRGLQLIGVTGSDISTVDSFLKQTETDFSVIFDKSHCWEKMQINSLPAILFLDKYGKIIYKQPLDSNAAMEQMIVKNHVDGLVE